MASITRRGIRWSVVAVLSPLIVISAGVGLTAQPVALSDPEFVARPDGRGVDSMQIDDGFAAVERDAQPIVAVSVPAIAVIQVDENGRVVAAMTNTGRPPRAQDDLWLMNPDGSMQQSSAERFEDQMWIGDFHDAGVFVAQTI